MGAVTQLESRAIQTQDMSITNKIVPEYCQYLPEPDRCSNTDVIFWTRSIKSVLSKLLTGLRYTSEQRQYTEAFTRYFVAPYLGKAPNKAGQPSQWRSFMTDDFTPIEYSWTWGDNARSAAPKIRFSIEPIGPDAGSSRDPWNTVAATSLLKGLSRFLQRLDLQWTEQLSNLLIPHETTSSMSEKAHGFSSSSSVFVAFELGDPEPMVKTYFVAGAKATVTGQTDEAVVYDALSTFAQQNQWQDLQALLNSLQTRGTTLGLSPFMVAVDCITPSHSRLKIYLRSQDTSFQAISEVMTMFNQSTQTHDGLAELRDLYIQLFTSNPSDPSTFNPTIALPHKSHQTGGMLYYIEIRPSSPNRTVKVYLPVKHYGKNDLHTANGLTTFLRSRNPSKAAICDDFIMTLKESCSHRPLDSDRGMQTYISCAIKNDKLDITSYLNPEIYHPARSR